jgi:hypothetical protein
MNLVERAHRAIQMVLGIWIVVAAVMLVRLHSVNLDELTPAYDSTEAAENYKSRMEATQTIIQTGNLTIN